MTDPEDPGANRLEGLVLALIFTLVTVVLLALIGVATRSGPAAGGWWTRPALAPGAALVLLMLANAITLWRDLADLRRNPPSPQDWAQARARVLAWLRPVEFLAYFAAYVWAIAHLGYFPATLVFVLGLLWRVGLTAPRWMLAGIGLSVFMIAVFRAGLGVWMPAPEVYDLFPKSVRLMLLRWF